MPPPWQKGANGGALIAVIDQEHGALVLLGSYHASGGLHNLAQPRKQIGVVLAFGRAKVPIHRKLHLLVDWVELRQAKRCNEGADQALAGEVDALRERPS